MYDPDHALSVIQIGAPGSSSGLANEAASVSPTLTSSIRVILFEGIELRSGRTRRKRIHRSVTMGLVINIGRGGVHDGREV